MSPSDRIFVVGLNHLNAPISSREKAVVSSRDLPAILEQLKTLAFLEEVVILSTCSRVEVFAVCADPRRGGELVRAWFARRAGAEIEPALYSHEGADALRHLFRVSSGLDSWIIGETEILSQVKKAYQSALVCGFTRRLLNRAFQSAIAAGKDVRTATGIQNGIHSIGGATALMARRIFGEKEGGGIVVFGAGQTAEAVVRHLAAKNFDRIIVANRTLENARAIVDKLGGTAVALAEGLALLDEVEVAVFSTSASEPLLSAAALARMLPRRRKPLFLVDLGVPRNVDPACAKLESVYLYDLDDLKRMIYESMKGKHTDKERAERLASLAAGACLQEVDKPPRVAPAPLKAVLTAAALAFTQMRSPSAASGEGFPNDAGSEEVDVALYPADVQKGYRLMLLKCSSCHKVSRPINAQFLELTEDEIKKAQTEQPLLFKNKLIWDIAPKSWSLKIHRMMLKPGSKIKPEEGKQIYEFLVYDAKIRKTGANAETWRKNRSKLLQDFSKENPDVYKTLFGDEKPPAADENERKDK